MGRQISKEVNAANHCSTALISALSSHMRFSRATRDQNGNNFQYTVSHDCCHWVLNNMPHSKRPPSSLIFVYKENKLETHKCILITPYCSNSTTCQPTQHIMCVPNTNQATHCPMQLPLWLKAWCGFPAPSASLRSLGQGSRSA